jgi:hypothetical protein
MNTLIHNYQIKMPVNQSSSSSSSSPQYISIQQVQTLLNEGYLVNRITHPATSTGDYSTLVDLIKPSEDDECLITAFGQEAIALSEFIEKVRH